MNEENVKEVKSKEDSDELTLDVNLCYSVSRAIDQLMSSVPVMSGKMTYAMGKNQKKISPILKGAQNKTNEIIKKNVKFKDDQPVLTEPSEEEIKQGAQPEYIYKSDDHNQKAQADLKKMYSEKVSIDWHLVSFDEFASLQIPPARNPNIALIMDLFIDPTTVPNSKLQSV